MRSVVPLFVLLALAGGAHAEERLTPQQERMRQCNDQAGDRELKGDQRRDFMRSCLSADARDLNPQQERMVACNRQAAGLKGEKRREFMGDCLRHDATMGASSPRNAQQQRMTACNRAAVDKNLRGEKRRDFMTDCLKG